MVNPIESQDSQPSGQFSAIERVVHFADERSVAFAKAVAQELAELAAAGRVEETAVLIGALLNKPLENRRSADYVGTSVEESALALTADTVETFHPFFMVTNTDHLNQLTTFWHKLSTNPEEVVMTTSLSKILAREMNQAGSDQDNNEKTIVAKLINKDIEIGVDILRYPNDVSGFGDVSGTVHGVSFFAQIIPTESQE